MLQRSAALLTVVLAASLTASADFSYTTTQKITGGAMAAMARANADRTAKIYFKGQKMMTVTGDVGLIMDFGAQTITTLDNAQKTYSVKKFADVTQAAGNADVKFDVRETGQKKLINGFNATEVIVTMNMDMDTGRGGPPAKMQIEMDLWISSDVPGADDMRAFYRKNAANYPLASMEGAGANPGMQKAMAQMERKMAQMGALNGVAVERVIRVKSASGAPAPQAAQMPQMNAQQQAQMAAAMAKLQQAQIQGGRQAAAAQQAMSSMGGMVGGAAPASASGAGSMIEMTIDAGGFSNASVPESVFAIPAGYKQTQ